MNPTKKQEWLDYFAALQVYQEQVKAFAQSLPEGDVSTEDEGDSSENPTPPLPPTPPK